MMKLYWPVRVEDGAWLHKSNMFGDNHDYYSDAFGIPGHNGLDFPANAGTPIYAVHDGWIVEQTHKDTGYGLRIQQRFEDGGRHYLLVYGHMSRLERSETFAYDWNAKTYPVRAGQVIGYVGNTGFSTGNHLHLGLYEQTEQGARINADNGYSGAIDPYPYLAGEMEKPGMTKFYKVNDHGKLGIMVIEGFTGVILFEDKMGEYMTLQQITSDKLASAETINIP
jgi:murein DD-endopeptidase MepM/ murein hydrolase activator NlpD